MLIKRLFDIEHRPSTVVFRTRFTLHDAIDVCIASNRKTIICQPSENEWETSSFEDSHDIA